MRVRAFQEHSLNALSPMSSQILKLKIGSPKLCNSTGLYVKQIPREEPRKF